MALYLDLKIGETLDIDQGQVRVRMEHKQGQRVRVKIDCDKAHRVTVEREAEIAAIQS
jgi:hypothetical protein